MKAGYDGIGIRTYRAPGRTYNFNPIVGNKDLERDVKSALKDSDLEVYDLYSFYLQPEMDWDTITPALEFGGEIGCKYVPDHRRRPGLEPHGRHAWAAWSTSSNRSA